MKIFSGMEEGGGFLFDNALMKQIPIRHIPASTDFGVSWNGVSMQYITRDLHRTSNKHKHIVLAIFILDPSTFQRSFCHVSATSVIVHN